MATLQQDVPPFISIRDLPAEDRWVPELAREKFFKDIAIASPEPVVFKPLNPDVLNHYHHVFQNYSDYIAEYTWDDYRPAYLYAINRAALADHDEELFDNEFESDWMLDQGTSRLSAQQAKDIVRRVWQERSDNLLNQEIDFQESTT